MENETIQVNCLLLDELTYELAIRDVVTSRNMNEKRKILSRLLARENNRPGSYDELPFYSFDLNAEKEAINSTLMSVSALIADFEGSATDSTFLRCKSRLVHVSGRIKRIDVTLETPEGIVEFKRESYATSLQLEAELYDKIANNADNSVNAGNLNPSSPIVNVSVPKVTCLGSQVPIADWPVKFNGDKRNVYSFLEKVTEIAKSRKVDNADLFNSAAELFVDDAFIWFRSIKNTVTTWESLVDKLKKDFLPPNADEEIWDSIKSRKQRKGESLTMFIAQLEALFSRLPNAPAETTKVKYIRRNLLADYISQLALIEIGSVDELASLGRKLEEAAYIRARNSNTQISTISTPSEKNLSANFKPNLSFSKNNTNRKNFNKKTVTRERSTVDPSSTNQPSTSRAEIIDRSSNTENKFLCWNCNKPNHRFSTCSQKRTTFCYRCGLSNVKVSSCPNCSKN